MTSFQNPLAAPQYTRLRTPQYGGSRVISLFTSTVILHGTIDTDLTGSGSWAQFAYTAISGTYTNTRAGMEMFVSPTNDIKSAKIYDRVRVLPDATNIYANENSDRVAAGTYFWIVDNHVPQYRLSRSSTLDPADNPEELLDYDQTYLKEPPVIIGLRTVYVGDVGSNGKLRIAIDINQPNNPSYAAESGATIAGVVWVFTGATYVEGSSTTLRIVVDFDPGFQWGQCALTDSEGTTWIRYVKIAAHNAANPPFDYAEGGTISGSIEQGWTFTLPAFAGVDDVLVNDFLCAWRRQEVYNNTSATLWGNSSAAITNKVLSSNTATLTAANDFEIGQEVIVVGVDTVFDGTHILTNATSTSFSFQITHADVGSTGCSGHAVVNANNVDFCGWIGSESDPLAGDPKYSVTTGANFEVAGIAARMARLWTEQLSFENNDSPSKNGQINNLTVWRALWHILSRYTTVADVCEVNFSNHDDTGYQFPVIPFPEDSVQAALNDLAAQINAIPTFAPWGAIAINRQAAYLSSAERGTLTIVGAFEAQDLLEAPRASSPLPDVSKVDAVGLFYNNAAQTVSLPAPQSRAPGYAPGEASGVETLDNQILQTTVDGAAALVELEERAGSKFNFENTKMFLDCTFPDGYVACQFIPSRDQLYTFSLTAVGGPNGVNRIEITTAMKWTVDTVSEGYDAKFGTFTVRVRFRLVSDVGDPGDDTTNYYVAPGTTINPLPDLGLDAFNFQLPEVLFPDSGLTPSQVAPSQLIPPPGKALKLDGGELMVWSTTKVYYERNFIALATPTVVDITPSDLGSFLIKQGVLAPNPTAQAAPAYLLASDGTNSAVWYNPNIAAPFASMNWTKGTEYTGVYSVIRVVNVAGYVEIYSTATAGGGTTYDYDFTVSNQGFVVYDDGHNPTGATYVAATGWESTDSGQSNNQQRVRIQKALPISGTLTSVTIYYDYGTPGPCSEIDIGTATVTFGQLSYPSMPGGAGQSHAFSNTLVVVTGNMLIVQLLGPCDNSASTITKLSIVYSEGGNANSRLSTNNGSTFASPASVGTTPGGIGGYDTQRAGGVAYAAMTGKVRKATALGGAYADFIATTGANPVCIIQPYYRRNSTTKNTTVATPDLLVALDQADSDGSTLYWVNGITSVKTDIIPTAGMTFSNANCISTRYGNEIVVFGIVSGAYKVYRSVNGGTTWTLVETATTPTFIRCRRNDQRPSPNGQLYLADVNMWYSSKWGSNGVFIRNQPTSVTGFDPIW